MDTGIPTFKKESKLEGIDEYQYFLDYSGIPILDESKSSKKEVRYEKQV